MDIQEIHEKYESWEYDCVGEDIVLLDKEHNELRSINVNALINLWFDSKDSD